MQNQSDLKCTVEYYKVDLPDSFAVTYPDKDTHSPSVEQVVYMHYHNNLELGYCYKGCGIFFVNGKVTPFSAGDASIIFPYDTHIAQSDKADPSQWKFINIDPLKLLSDIKVEDLSAISLILTKNSHVNSIFTKNDELGLNRLIYELINELEQQNINYKPMVRSLAWSIIVRLSRIDCSNTPGHSSITNQALLKIAPALKYISENYMNPVSMDMVASRCNLSLSHMRRLFDAAMSMSPSEYLYSVRIKMASILLVNLDISILEISMKVGYPTLSSFNRHFLKIMGMSPREWKNKNSNFITNEI